MLEVDAFAQAVKATGEALTASQRAEVERRVDEAMAGTTWAWKDYLWLVQTKVVEVIYKGEVTR